MTDEELEKLVQAISLEYFERSFNHKVTFNRRLRTTGGRYHLNTHNLDFNPKILKVFGLEVFIGIVKHELCHYHLHIENKGYRHRDRDFKELLQKVEGLRYTPSIELEKGILLRWVYSCQRCQEKLYRKRRFNVNQFVCAHCEGRLRLEGQKELKV